MDVDVIANATGECSYSNCSLHQFYLIVDDKTFFILGLRSFWTIKGFSGVYTLLLAIIKCKQTEKIVLILPNSH